MCTDARRAGWLYLLVVLTGVFSLLWVPSQVPLGEGGAALLDRMRAHEALFRWGIAAFVVMQVAFALLPLALHRLLAPAGPRAAAAMVGLAWLSVPLGLVAVQGRMALLGMLDAPLAAGEAAWAMPLALATWRHGLLLTQLFWGLWLLPLAWLLWRSRLAPRVLAAALLAGGVGYAVQVAAALLWPTWEPAWLAALTLPAAVGEIGLCGWLLVVNPSATSRWPLRCCPARRRSNAA